MTLLQESKMTTPLTWHDVLADEQQQPYFLNTLKTVAEERQSGITIYPPQKDVFNAFRFTELGDVKVVILGQDPYHGAGQAHGLCFSVQPGVRIPPSLVNIYKEMESDLGIPRPAHGFLESWARQGVLLLNSVLTVEEGRAGSHQGKGWEGFTDHVVDVLNREREGLVFLLWGSYAQAKGRVIDTRRHRVLKAPHPSPLSAHRGFLGCKHFSAVNEYLRRRGEPQVDWMLPRSWQDAAG